MFNKFHKSMSHGSLCMDHKPNLGSSEDPTLKAWSLLDTAMYKSPQAKPVLPLVSFNHIAREVINVEKSKNFYCDLLGFVVVPRPPFECEGYWLWGYGLSLHIVETRNKKERRSVLKARYEHFTNALPRVDHFAFMSDNLAHVRSILDAANVFYKFEAPANTGIEQIFFFDPDGNVIEVSTCSVTAMKSWCHESSADNTQQQQQQQQQQSAPVSNTPTSPGPSDVIVGSSEVIVGAIVVGTVNDTDGYCMTQEDSTPFLELQYEDGSTDRVLISTEVKSASEYQLTDSDFMKTPASSVDSPSQSALLLRTLTLSSDSCEDCCLSTSSSGLDSDR